MRLFTLAAVGIIVLTACSAPGRPTLRVEAEQTLPGSIRILNGPQSLTVTHLTIDREYQCEDLPYFTRTTAVILIANNCKNAAGEKHKGVVQSLDLVSAEGEAHWTWRQ